MYLKDAVITRQNRHHPGNRRACGLMLISRSSAADGCEPCQAGNRAALSGCASVRRSRPVRPYARRHPAVTSVHRLAPRFFCGSERERSVSRPCTGNGGLQTFSDGRTASRAYHYGALRNEVAHGQARPRLSIYCGSRGTGKTTCAKDPGQGG